MNTSSKNPLPSSEPSNIRKPLEFSQLRWRLGANRASPEGRKWGLILFAGFVVAGTMSKVSGFPAWWSPACIAVGFTIVGIAYWKMEKISDRSADELTLLVRQRALRFTFSSLIILWVATDLLNHVGYFSEFQWTSKQLVFISVGLYLVGSFVASRRYV